MIERFRSSQGEFRRLRAAEGFALRGEFLSQRWERNQRIAGDAADGLRLRFAPPRSIGLLSPDPITGVTPWGGQNPSGAQNLSGGLRFLPAHWGLGLQKLGLVRFRSRACRFRTNGTGANSGGRMLCAPTGFRWTVGAAISRPKAFPFRGRCPRRGRMRCAAKGRLRAGPYGKAGEFPVFCRGGCPHPPARAGLAVS